MVKKTALDIRSVLERLDTFGKPLPGFNIKGRDKVTTIAGGVSTILISGIVLLYATTKLLHMESKNNPNISSFIREAEFNSEDILNLNEMNFRVAFALKGSKLDLKNDPRYVKWIFRVYGKKDGERYEKILNHHVCTDEDYAQFSPIAKSSAKKFEDHL